MPPSLTVLSVQSTREALFESENSPAIFEKYNLPACYETSFRLIRKWNSTFWEKFPVGNLFGKKSPPGSLFKKLICSSWLWWQKQGHQADDLLPKLLSLYTSQLIFSGNDRQHFEMAAAIREKQPRRPKKECKSVFYTGHAIHTIQENMGGNKKQLLCLTYNPPTNWP